MARDQLINIIVEPWPHPDQPEIEEILKVQHGIHGLSVLGRSALSELVERPPELQIVDTNTGSLFIYTKPSGEMVSISSNEETVSSILSRFVLDKLAISLDQQSSRNDYKELGLYSGARPNLQQDPSLWIVGNPIIGELFRRYPQYGNLVRFLCNERGLFLKVGNYTSERAYWNSTTNGGLPIYKKADPIHEGTFMLHDLFHFVPTDPIIDPNGLSDVDKQTYVAHRLLSEATTLVLADMVGIYDASLDQYGYDTSKRKIFPLYESIIKNTGKRPSLDKLLAANAYFCFTGDTAGFEALGPSPEAVEAYKSKYEVIFRDDFSWNLQNINSMLSEMSANPKIAEYYSWLIKQEFVPSLTEYNAQVQSDQGVNIAKMLSLFRANFTNALNYQEPLDNKQRYRLAALKYLSGQRIIFARYGNQVDLDEQLKYFDGEYESLKQASSNNEIAARLQEANNIVDNCLAELDGRGLLLPHEISLNTLTAPLYPIRFVKYERKGRENLSSEIDEFLQINKPQVRRLLEIAMS